MSDLTFVAGDTAPPVTGTILDKDGAPVNLTGATVRFQMRLVIDRRWTVDADAEVVSAPDGTVKYEWETGDLGEPGDYVSRWFVTNSDTTIEHTTPQNTIAVQPQ